MIQRQQTLWLLLATIGALFTFMFPFVTGKTLQNGATVDHAVNASSNIILLILTIISLLLSSMTIFLYKNRRLQMKLCVLGMLVSAGMLVLYILEMRKFVTSTLALFCILPLIVFISFILAYRGVRKDEKLVRSLDKIR
jgi:hypothetical protein